MNANALKGPVVAQDITSAANYDEVGATVRAEFDRYPAVQPNYITDGRRLLSAR